MCITRSIATTSAGGTIGSGVVDVTGFADTGHTILEGAGVVVDVVAGFSHLPGGIAVAAFGLAARAAPNAGDCGPLHRLAILIDHRDAGSAAIPVLGAMLLHRYRHRLKV